MGAVGSAFSRIGKVIDHAIDKFVQLILETRKGYNQTVFLYSPAGDNSVPCKEDRVVILKIDGTGRYISAGILTESQGAKPGEKIFFGRDADGKVVSKLSFLNDGSINAEADGDVTSKTKGAMNAEVEGELTLKIKGDITIEGEGALNEKAGGDVSREAGGKYKIKASEIEISGDQKIILKTIGSALWCPNGTKICYMTGGPHGGDAMGITGLVGS